MRDAVLLLALAACSGHETAPPPAPVEVLEPGCADEGPLAFYPPAEPLLSDARWARDRWATVLRPERRLRFSLTGHQRIVLLPTPTPGLIGQWTGSDVGLLYVDPDATQARARILLHEQGHVAGLDHVPYPGNVMCGRPERPEVQPAPPPPDCGPIPDTFGAADLEEASRVGARDP